MTNGGEVHSGINATVGPGQDGEGPSGDSCRTMVVIKKGILAGTRACHRIGRGQEGGKGQRGGGS